MRTLIFCLVALVGVAPPAIAQDAGPALSEPMPTSALQNAGPASAPVDTSAPVTPAASSPSSPIAKATAAPDTAWDLIEQHGPIWGGMLLLFGIVTAFLKRNEKERWIGKGRKLAIVVGGAGILGSVLEAGVNGGTWAGVIVTAVAAWKLLITPTTGPQPNVTEPLSATLGALLLTGLIVANAAGCATFKSSARGAVASFVDCLAPNTKALAGELQGTVADVVRNATDNTGKVDWSSVRSSVRSYKSDAPLCAFQAAVRGMLLAARAPKDPDAPQSAGLEVDPASLTTGYESVRLELFAARLPPLELAR